MFTDIVGYTALMQQDEQQATEVRARHRSVFSQQHQIHTGEILQYFGDGTLSVFQSGVEAVECAIAIQRALNNKEPVVPLRIGLHVGDIVFDGTEIYGDGVNLASRIESLGIPGSILLSGRLNDELKNQPHLSTLSMGHFQLKNVSELVEVFCVTNEGIKAPAPSDLTIPPQKPTKSIAVLPFVNMSSSRENEYFSDGMTEEIINALTKIKDLKVTSRTSSFFFKNKNIPIQEIGRELNVAIILEGSIRLSGSKLRITAQLIDVADDVHFWSETFDRSMEDIFALQDEISLLIADKLREQIGHLEIEDHLVEAPDVSVDAYKRYLKARYHLLKMTKADIDKGMSMLQEIIAEQPQYAMAHLGIHMGYTLIGTIGLSPAVEAFEKGQVHLDKAIELAPELPECQLNLAWNSFLQDWNAEAAYEHLKKAMQVRPVVDFYQTMASILVAERKFAAALQYIDIATQLDPFSAVNYHLKGFIHYGQELFEQAIDCFRQSLKLKPDFPVPTLYWGLTLIAMDQPEKGLAFFEQLPPDQHDVLKLGGITVSHAALGHAGLADRGKQQLEAALQTDLMERALNLLIYVEVASGKKEAAMDWIDKGIQYRLPMMVYLYIDPLLKPLHAYPRFQKQMQQILGEETSFDFSQRKYKKTLFTEAELHEQKSRLEAFMIAEKPFLDPNLTLRSLAGMLDLQPNYLSQLLNEGFDKNFAEYVNTFRLETFKKKVADPANRQLTILGLAYDSGFNSKTVFNTFFKKMMGKTPSAYWKEVVR